MPFHRIPEVELRDDCRRTIENLENWLRRLIHEEFSDAYGADYLLAQTSEGRCVLRKDRLTNIQSLQKGEPERFARLIDAAFLDDVIYLFCREDHYQKCFRKVTQSEFPEGVSFLRQLLKRVQDARNALSHANPISVRDAEKVVCYSNDIIDSIKDFYKGQGMEREYNVPTIVRLTDSFGELAKSHELGESRRGARSPQNRPYQDAARTLCPGDRLTIEVEVDSSFPQDSYDVFWRVAGDNIEGTKLVLTILDQHVGERLRIRCTVISKEPWHRFQTFDDAVVLDYKVTPNLQK